MAGNEERASTASSSASSKSSTAPFPPKISLPPRASLSDAFFNNNGAGLGFSPGPMTLVSNFFADSDDCKSFSQLLAGAMASPAAAGGLLKPNFSEQGERSSGGGGGGGGGVDFRFKQNKPADLVIAQPPPG